MLKREGRRLLSIPRLISGIGLIYLLFVSFMILSVVAANLIPNGPILRHLRLSLPSENYSVPFGSTHIDSWTECVAATVGIGPADSKLGLIETSLLSPILGNCEQSWKFLNTGTYEGYDYWRYWHGSQIITRPALALTSVLNVRGLTFLLFTSAFMFAFLALYRHGLHLSSFALFAGLFCVHLQSPMFILPHAVDWAIGFLACGWIVTKLKGRTPISVNGFSCAFFFIGLLSAFFGLLNNPLVSLTIPLFGVFWAVAFQKEKAAVESFVLVLMATSFWLTGYALCWSTKWLLAISVVGTDISQILDVVKLRLGGPFGTSEVTWTESHSSVLRQNRNGIIFAIASVIASLVPLVRFLKSVKRQRSDLMSFVFICALPFVWFAALRNHTIEHAWFASAGLYITFAMVFSLLLTSWALKSSLFERTWSRP